VAEFEREVGLQYLRGMHINDSKVALGSKKDRHENIGLGHLKLSTFAHILTDPRTRDIPLILETPAFDTPGSGGNDMDVWRKEVDVLNQLSMVEGRVCEDVTLEGWRGEIAAVVKKASAAKDAKGKRRADGANTKQKAKKAKKAAEGDEHGDGGGCSCSELDGEES